MADPRLARENLKARELVDSLNVGLQQPALDGKYEVLVGVKDPDLRSGKAIASRSGISEAIGKPVGDEISDVRTVTEVEVLKVPVRLDLADFEGAAGIPVSDGGEKAPPQVSVGPVPLQKRWPQKPLLEALDEVLAVGCKGNAGFAEGLCQKNCRVELRAVDCLQNAGEVAAPPTEEGSG